VDAPNETGNGSRLKGVMSMSCCESDMTGMMGMMSKMMEGDQLNMMMEMMPKCLGMMLQKVPKEKRTEFVLKMVTTLVT
jgi:hypothetical protein